MTFQQELRSWMTPTAVKVSPAPEVGAKVPTSSDLPIPNANGKPTVVTFLRHCGCPFAEKTFQDLRNYADENKDVNFVAVSHSDRQSTDRWLEAVGGERETKVIVDPGREIYAQWGMGVSSYWQVLSPSSLYSVYKLGREEGIWNRPTESGSRWQTAGSFAVDGEGVLRWVTVAKGADDLPDFQEALRSIGLGV